MVKFWIVIGSVIVCLAIAAITTIIILNKQTIKVNFEFAKIETVNLYNESTIATKVTDSDFEQLKDKLNASMNLKKLDIIGKNIKIDTSVRVLIDEKYSKTILATEKCVELVFGETQSQIVNFGSNTKKINYKKLLIVLNGSSEISDHVVYYSASEGDYQDQPMLIAFNELPLTALK